MAASVQGVNGLYTALKLSSLPPRPSSIACLNFNFSRDPVLCASQRLMTTTKVRVATVSRWTFEVKLSVVAVTRCRMPLVREFPGAGKVAGMVGQRSVTEIEEVVAAGRVLEVPDNQSLGSIENTN